MLRLLLTALTILMTKHTVTAQDLSPYRHNKVIPETIETPVLTALSYYPELKGTNIRFIFTHKLKKSIMAARPKTGSLFKKREKRTYDVLINPAFKLDYEIESIGQVPDSVMVGWIGHELGHIMDYERKNTWGIMGMGISYWLSRNYVRKAERIADSFAVDRGMGPYLVVKKSFILDHTELPQAYKDRIAALYLSPDDIDQLVAELEHEDPLQQAEIQIDETETTYEIEAEMHEESLPGNG